MATMSATSYLKLRPYALENASATSRGWIWNLKNDAISYPKMVVSWWFNGGLMVVEWWFDGILWDFVGFQWDFNGILYDFMGCTLWFQTWQWKISQLNRGFDRKISYKWSIFQQTVFDCRMVIGQYPSWMHVTYDTYVIFIFIQIVSYTVVQG